MVLSLLLASMLMAGKGLTMLLFSGGDRAAWSVLSVNGQAIGVVPETPCEPSSPACYGMGRLADGTIWAATNQHFFTFSPDLKTRTQGSRVETIAGSGTRHLYRIRRGESLRLKPPALEHAAVLEEIDPRTWSVTRSWTLPGHYRAYGAGHLSVDERAGVAYFATEQHPISHASESMGVVRRFDLASGLPLADLITRTVGSGGLQVLADGSVIVGYTDGVQRFGRDGSHLRMYPVGALRVGQGLIAAGATGSTFWVQGFADGTPYSTLFELDLDGTIRHEWNTPKDGTQWDAPFVDPSATACVPKGSIAFTEFDTSPNAPVVYVDPATFGILTVVDRENGDPFLPGDALDDGRYISGVLGTDPAGSDFSIRSACTQEFIGFISDHAGDSPDGGAFLRGNYTDRFYVGSAGTGSGIMAYGANGAFIQRWATPRSVKAVAVGPANDIAYYTSRSSGNTHDIFRHDLVNDVDLGAWVTEATRIIGLSGNQRSVLVRRDGTILAGWSGAGSTTSQIVHYAADGSVLHTYVRGATSDGFSLAADPGDDTFWTVYTGNAETNTCEQIRVGDGASLLFHEITNAEWNAVVAATGVGGAFFEPHAFHITREDCNCAMACPDPCEDAGKGEPYFALLPEGLRTYFYDRAFALISTYPNPVTPTGVPGCQLAASSEGVWICYDDGDSGNSVLFLVDPKTIDGTDMGLPLATLVRGPIEVEVRIGELGGSRALFVLDCDRLLTVDRSTHEMIEICLPKKPTDKPGDVGYSEGTALVAKRYSLVVDPFDAQLIDGGDNVLYLDGGDAKIWNRKNDALLKTVGTTGGRWPYVASDNTLFVFTGDFRTNGDILRYKRSGTLLNRYTYDQSQFSIGAYNFVVDRQTDACSCGNPKDGVIFIPGEDFSGTSDSGVVFVPLLPTDVAHVTGVALSDIIEGSIDTAAAFIIIGANNGSGFSDQSGNTVRRPQPDRHCGPEAGISSVAPNPGCNAGGKGWTPTYTGDSGTVPAATDPSDEETLTNKDTVFIRVKVRHTDYPSATDEVLCYAKTDLAANLSNLTRHPHASPRVLSIGDDDRGLSDGQGNMVSGSTNLQFMDGDGRPFGLRLTSPTKQFWTRDELVLEAISDDGLRTNAIPRRIGTGLTYGEQYGGPVIFGLTAVDPLFIEGGSFGPDKKVPQFTYPLDYYTSAPADLAQLPMPFGYGEVSDEGAISPVTGLPNSRGKWSVRFVGYDTLGTAPGGATWGRFNICRSACYRVIALYGPDLGGLGLYGAAATASSQEVGDNPDATATTEISIVTLNGSPDLSTIAVDGSMQIVLFGASGRTEAVIVGVDNFAKTVTLESTVDPTLFASVPWYISSIDYVPRRVKIDLATRNGVDVQVPTQGGYVRPTPYEDIPTSHGTMRVVDMWATGAILASALSGEVTFAVNIILREDKGDGSGLPIIDYFTAFNHFVDNEVHIQSGLPTGAGNLWPQSESELPKFSDGFSKTKQSSFAAAQAITVRALGGRGLQVNAAFTEAISMRDALQLWIENGACKTGTDEYGRFYVWILDRYADSSTFPRIRHEQRVFGEPPDRSRALDEAFNYYKGGCDWDPEAQAFREDDLTAVSEPAITRNKGFVRYSKHVDLKLLAYKEQAEWVLSQALLVNQDGPVYVTIHGLDRGVLDVPIGSGIRFSSQMLPGASEDGMVDQPLLILHRTFNMDTHLADIVCLDLGTEAAANSLLISAGKRMISTDDNSIAPISTDDDTVAPVAA